MKIIGIFRGFPGLGRVVSGVGLLETLRDSYGWDVEMISYLQGKKYLIACGYGNLPEVSQFDYSSIGLVPTNNMGLYIHKRIQNFSPDIVLIDGEPLILQSVKLNFPNVKVVTLLNPSDVENPSNDEFSMNFFNHSYALSDLAIVHGLRKIIPDVRYNNMISIDTILRPQILKVKNVPSSNIYCILGGGTLNVGQEFIDSTIRIAELCKQLGPKFESFNIHIICSSKNVYSQVNTSVLPNNVYIRDYISEASQYYSDASLIITRSGRNTLSEVAYLKIPTITFVSGCKFRRNEQQDNLDHMIYGNVVMATTDINVDEFYGLCKKVMLHSDKSSSMECGNNVAIQKILELV